MHIYCDTYQFLYTDEQLHEQRRVSRVISASLTRLRRYTLFLPSKRLSVYKKNYKVQH